MTSSGTVGREAWGMMSTLSSVQSRLRSGKGSVDATSSTEPAIRRRQSRQQGHPRPRS